MLRLFRINGHSLSPEYKPGDFVLVSKIPFCFHPPKTGDVIAFMQPGYGLLIKVVTHYDQITQTITVQGTHLDSIDSREFGTVPIKQVIGKILWHIRANR